MNRIESTFRQLRQDGRKGLVGYLTAGDPDLKTSEGFMRTALANGVDILEIGVPFSDPTADGPTIQAAGQRALKAGTTLGKVLHMARSLRRSFSAPFILFSYANPLLAYGYAKLARDAAAAGIDGVLVVDMPFEESDEFRAQLRRHGLAFIQLLAPTTSPARAQRLLEHAEGFVYYILVKGVTGARNRVVSGAHAHLADIRGLTTVPVAAGFGISRPEHVRQVAKHADAVVVGSALVEAAAQGRLKPFVRRLARALRAP